MFLDAYDCSGETRLRIVHKVRRVNAQGVVTRSRMTYQKLGPISGYDDGQPNLLERLKKQFKEGTLPGVDYDALPNFESADTLSIIVHRGEDDYRDSYDGKHMGHFFVEAMFDALGLFDVACSIKARSELPYDFPGLFKLLVVGRALDPGSKFHTYQSAADYVYPFIEPYNPDTGLGTSVDRIYEALDVISDNRTKFLTRMNTKLDQLFGLNTETTYYDVTNFYVETMLDRRQSIDGDGNIHDGVARRGKSKENRKSPIVQMGLLMDQNGMPLTYKMYPGNRNDQRTLLPSLHEFKRTFNIGRIVMICDRGISGAPNRGRLIQEGHGYIMAQSLTKSYTEQKAWLEDPEGFTETVDADGTVIIRTKERIVDQCFKLYEKDFDEDIDDREAIEKYGDTKNKGKLIVQFSAQEKVVLYWSKTYYDKACASNRDVLKKLSEIEKLSPEELNPKDPVVKRFLKSAPRKKGEAAKGSSKESRGDVSTGESESGAELGDGCTQSDTTCSQESPKYELDWDKIEKFRNSMGFYLVKTSELALTADEVMNRYHGLVRIENCFRIDKSNLKIRPVYVQTDKHIDAHLLTCFAALLIIRSIQRRVLATQNLPPQTDGWKEGITAEHLQEALGKFCVALVGGNYQISKPDDFTRLIHKAFDVKLPRAWMTPSELRSYHRAVTDAAAKPLNSGPTK